MSTGYVGEIRMFAGNFAPYGWVTCDGQLLSIAQNSVVFNLIGTTYGGDGINTFGIPNLSGRLPLHMGQGTGLSQYTLGQLGGVASVTVTSTQMPAHTHTVVADSGGATNDSPSNAYYATATPKTPYSVPGSASNPRATPTYRSMSATMLPNAGNNQAHSNLQPAQAVLFILSLFGVFPAQN